MSTDAVLNFLKGIPLFSSLGPVLLARLADNSASLKFNKGTTILDQGKNCNNLFIVASGRLEVYRKGGGNGGLTLQTLGRGGMFGEAFVLDGSPVAASLRAAENSVVIGIDRLTLSSLVRDNTEFARNYIKHLGGMIRDSIDREEKLLAALISSGGEIPDSYNFGNKAPQPEAPAAAGQIGQVEQPEEAEEEGESDQVFFRKEYACPLCSSRFRTLKPRQKQIIVERADEDFCLYYKTVNPLYYEINVCPKCGYSFNSSTGGPVKPELKKGLAKMLGGLWKPANYSGQRTLEDAVQTFRLALECQRLMGADDSTLGKFFLKLGWLYRYLNQKDQERQSLDSALHHLSKSFETGSDKDPKEEMNLMFLLGQLHLKLGDEKGAVNWFVRITQHPEKKSYPYIVNRARDTWQEIRKGRN